MPCSRRHASAHVYPNGSPARHARITCGSYRLMPILTERPRSMPISTTHFARALVLSPFDRTCPGSVSAAVQSLMLISTQRRLVMLCRTFSAFGHAHPVEALARLAPSGAACTLFPAALAQPALAVDAASRRQDR